MNEMISDEDVRQQAVAFAKANKKKIARELTDSAIYPPEPDPVAVFMAGSPGAGQKPKHLRRSLPSLKLGAIRRFYASIQMTFAVAFPPTAVTIHPSFRAQYRFSSIRCWTMLTRTAKALYWTEHLLSTIRLAGT
jgi:hypothetical protein